MEVVAPNIAARPSLEFIALQTERTISFAKTNSQFIKTYRNCFLPVFPASKVSTLLTWYILGEKTVCLCLSVRYPEKNVLFSGISACDCGLSKSMPKIS